MSSSDPPFDGDPAWRVTRTLRDGTVVTLRPLVPEDREELRREFMALSAQTRYFRFLALTREPSDELLDQLTQVDQKSHVAIAAVLASPDLKTERGVGVGRFVLLDDAPDVAEVAITVVDDMHRRGLGTILAYELDRAARARGIRAFRADVLADNAAMRAILENAGARAVGDAGDGTLAYEIDLEDPVPPAPISRRLVDVLRGAAETMALTFTRKRPASRVDD